TNEHHQIRFHPLGVAGSKQPAETRNATEPGYALLALTKLIVHEAAEDEHFAIVHEHGRRDGAVVGDEVDGARSACADARRLLLEGQLQTAAFVDLRSDPQPSADFFALDGLEWIDGAVAAAAGVGERTGQEGHL